MHSLIDDIDLFIFDWDGTLSTSTLTDRLSPYFKRRYWPNSLERYLAEHSGEEYKEGKMPEIERDIRIIERRKSIYLHLYEFYALFYKPRLKKNALEVLDFLKSHKKKVAIFTDGRTVRLFREMHKLDISMRVDLALAADYIKRYKPDPTGIRLVAKELGVSRERSVYIGDKAVDMVAARLAGVKACGICDGVDPCEKLKMMNPDYIMHNLEEFYDKLAVKRS